MSRYREVHRAWQDDPQAFWSKAAQAIDWFEPFDSVLDDSRAPFYRWFPGGSVNTCWNAVDRHVAAGHGGRLAVVWDSAMENRHQTFTYKELQHEVSVLAGALARLEVSAGDRVLIYMPMIPQALFAMLACARLGAIHSVVFGGFAPQELAKRINDARPRVVLSASCGLEPHRVVEYKPLLDEGIRLATPEARPEHVVVLERAACEAPLDTSGRDLDWGEFIDGAKGAPCVRVASSDPLYILYTSGTTGIPKGVVRDNGGHMVALAWSMENVYGVRPGEVYWAASDIGWVVGHSYIVYAPLLHGCTTILFEGKPVGTPDAGTFWRVLEQWKVSTMFTAPTAFRAIKRDDPSARLLRGRDLSAFRALFLAGERADPDTLRWAEKHLEVPVIDHWWQTETGWPIVANCLGLGALPVKHGSPTVAVPGYSVRVEDEEGRDVPADAIGSIVIDLPLPPGCLTTLWNNDRGYLDSYLDDQHRVYRTGDAGTIDEDGYLYILSRTDDLINVAGHRLSTGGMEEVLADHPDVAECAVLGVSDPLKGQVPLGLVVLNAETDRDQGVVVRELIAAVRERIGPVAAFKLAAVVERLPKTRSGKVLRGTMRMIADGEDWTLPATIDEPAILGEIEQALAELGFPRSPGGPR